MIIKITITTMHLIVWCEHTLFIQIVPFMKMVQNIKVSVEKYSLLGGKF